MPLKVFAFSFVFFNTVFCSLAQTAEDFENFGREIFTSLTDTSLPFAPEYIRIKEYEYLIDQQKASYSQKELMKHQINQNYTEEYIRYQKNTTSFSEEYQNEVINGASMEYSSTYWEPLEGSELSYTIETTYLYKTDRVQTEVRIVYDVAWIRDHFVILGLFEEDF